MRERVESIVHQFRRHGGQPLDHSIQVASGGTGAFDTPKFREEDPGAGRRAHLAERINDDLTPLPITNQTTGLRARWLSTGALPL